MFARLLMKNSISRFLLYSTAAVVAWALTAGAQMPGPGGSPGMNAAMAKLFGENKAFTAKADVQVVDGSDKEIASMPMDFAFLDGKVRVEIDMTKAKSSNMPPGAAEQLKQMGMAQIVSIVRPDKKQIFVIYPDQKSLMAMPLAQDDAAEKDTKLNRTELGKETVDGHPCIKNKVIIDSGKQKVEATTWEATDMKKFPVRIQTKDKDNTSTVNFKEVQFAKPEAGKFEPPSGYTTYNSPQEMMQGMMNKMSPQGQGGAEKK